MRNLQDYSEKGLEILKEVINEGLFLNEAIEVIENKNHDVKINIDKILSDQLIYKLELNTGLKVLSEEDFSLDNFTNELYWIIDPLDGSYNYLKGFPFYAISIALVENKKPLVGIIYDIPGRKTFHAIRGFGAYVNGNPLKPPKKMVKADSIIMTGIPSYLNDSDELALFWSELKEKQQEFKKIRMIGSATMSIIAVITGVANHYFENKIAFWDVAAAICIAEELSIVCDYDFSVSLYNRVLVNNYD